jgi:hypothetical protein
MTATLSTGNRPAIDRRRRLSAAVGAAALLVWIGLADSSVAQRAGASERTAARPGLEGALRGALRGALLARRAGGRSRAQPRAQAPRPMQDQRPKEDIMRRIPILIGVGLVAAATATAIAVAGGSAQVPGDQTLTLVERWIPAADVYVDVPPATKTGSGTGDGYLFRNDVLDADGDTRLGVHEARCSYLKATPRVVGSRLICDGVYSLEGGTIAVTTAFTYTQHPRISFVVTGGSGAYEGARGSGVLTYRAGKSPFADTTIHLLP